MKARKLFALLLAVVMVLSLSAPALAAGEVDDPTTGSITIENPQSGETYTAYQIFEMSFEGTNPRVPTPQSYVTPYHPYNYYIDKDSPWCATVITYAENDDLYWDHDNDEGSATELNPATPRVRKPGTGLILDPVYSTTGALEGYNVTYDEHFDAALFAAALQKALANDATKAEINKTENAKYKKVLTNGKADDLPFGYYLVDPTVGALASLTSTDPDVVISDKNEMPKVDKVIVEEKVTPTAEYDATAPVNYVAYEIFHKPIKENSNIEWGRDVNAAGFEAALKNNTALDEAFVYTYGEPTDTTTPGDTAARKWCDLYIDTYEDAYVTAAYANRNGSGHNALNAVNPGSTYLVEMIKMEGNPAEPVSKGFAICTPGSNKLNLDRVKFKLNSADAGTLYEAPPVAETPELREIKNEVKANGASIGETMTFKLTAEVPNMTGFDQYFFVMNDEMDYALTYEDDIKVYLNKNANENPTEDSDLLTEDKKDGSGGDYFLEVTPIYALDEQGHQIPAVDRNGNEIAGEYEIEKTEIRIIFKNMIQYRDYDHDGNGDTTVIDLKGQPITITYTATLNQYADVGAPALNTAFIEFSKDPTVNVEWTGTEGSETYDPRDTDTDEYKYTDKDGTEIPENKFKDEVYPDGPKSTTETYTAELFIEKENPERLRLPGAKFRITGPAYQVVQYRDNEEGLPTVFKKDAAGEWVLVNDDNDCEYKPADKEITYELADYEFIYGKAIVFEPKTGTNAEVRENGDYWHDEDNDPEEYMKIGTGEDETPIEQVPINAVLYERVYAIPLYKPNETAQSTDPIDEQYTELTTLEEADAYILEGNFPYYRTEVSLKDRLDPENNKYTPVLTDLIHDDTDRTNFLYDGYTDDEGRLSFCGLGEGTYTIEELIAPNGYNLLRAPITVVVTFDETTKKFSATIDGEPAEMGDYNGNDDIIYLTVVNYQGAELPETGGIGTTIFYTLGGLLVLSAGILLITRKRMGAED